ncbi:MAG TPA: metallophosphoesterase family protein [Nitrospirota bacterium]
MKIGVISDTHVPTIAWTLPPAIYDIFKGADLILHAGDIVELSVLDELRAIAPVEAVAGNMDDSEVHRKLPAKKVLSLGGYSAGLIHGKYKIDIQREMIRKEFGDVDLIVYGHSHTPYWGKAGDVYFLNPGSPTDTVHAPYHSVALLYVEADLRAEIVRI